MSSKLGQRFLLLKHKAVKTRIAEDYWAMWRKDTNFQIYQHTAKQSVQ